jgi:hypothetical protein
MSMTVDLQGNRWCVIDDGIVLDWFGTHEAAWRWIDRFEAYSRYRDRGPLIRLMLQTLERHQQEFPTRESRRDRPASQVCTTRGVNVIMQNNPTTQNNLPATFIGDGEDDAYSDRLLQGGRAKWVDKIWTLDGAPPREDERFFVADTGFALQRWIDGLPEVITERPLPNVAVLNDAIPRDEWPISKFTGQPEAPWKIVAFVYLLRTHDAARYTHINSTWGTRLCVRSIRERIRDMGALRGVPVRPIVRLTSVPMPSKKFPGRFRPEFEVIDWHDRSGNQPAQIEPPKQTEQIGKAVAEPTLSEELNDSIPL